MNQFQFSRFLFSIDQISWMKYSSALLLFSSSFTIDIQYFLICFFRYPPQYSEIMSDYERTTTTSAGNTKTVPRSELSAKSNRSTSSGRGSVEEDEDADVEIRMINEGNWNMQTSVQSTTGKLEKI